MGWTSHSRGPAPGKPKGRAGAILSAWLAALIAGAAILAQPAQAQAARSFTNSTSGSINLFNSCTSPLVRNFTVTSNFLVGDVDIGVRATHTWRGDIQITLQSPQGTRQQLVNGDAETIDGDNFNVLLNDSGTQRVNTDNPAASHSTTAAPPYQNNFSPDAPLSVFNGQQSAGTWRLEICDLFAGQDNGTFVRSDLYLTPATNAGGTGATFVVNSTADSGTGTLRQAVTDANATTTEADSISFAISGAGPHTITLTSALPDITDNGLLIDGTTQSGTQCRDLWAGNGHDLRVNVRRSGTSFDGFRLTGANQTIRGLSISGFTNAVVPAATSNNATVHCNYIGLLANGTSNNNGGRGLNVFGASARIGGLNAGEGNVISSSGVSGIVTNSGSTDTSIQGNFIGTDATGMSARSSGNAINHFNGSATWRDITRNLISGNSGNVAIRLETDDRITPSNGQVRIQSNRIGFNRTLSALMLNGSDAIQFASGSISDVLIGGLASSQGNEIAGTADGISITNATNVLIQGNTIARSGGSGIRLNNVNGGTIGGDAATLGNVIGGNGGNGIYLLGGARNLAIEGNQIGRATITSGTFDNQGYGIQLESVSSITIGNGSATGRNVLGRNGRRAIQGIGTNAGITINGNYIGTDTTGNAAVTNGQNDTAIARDAIFFGDNGSFSNLSILNNVIGGYEAAQIEVWTGTGNGLVIQGNSIGVGANGTSQIVSGNTQELFRMGNGSFSSVLIGGSSPGQGNLMAFSGQDGVRLESTGSDIQVIGNTIRNNGGHGIYMINSTRAAIVSNRIYSNGQLGIDLSDNGVTSNDLGDGDSGPNDMLNFPLINSVNSIGASQLAYNLTLDAPAAASGYRIEFFANSAADSSNHGEGERYLGFLNVSHAGGAQTYTGTLTTLEPIGSGSSISTTATRRTAGGAWDITSEFSAVASAGGLAALSATMTSELFEPPPDRPFATPGNDVILSMTVQNTGAGYTDLDSIFLVMSVSNDNVFYNAATPVFGGVVGFTTGSPLLTFNPATDLAYSNAATRPASFAECTYTPQPGYDPLVKHLCLNPKGTLPNGSPTGQFTIRIRARIR